MLKNMTKERNQLAVLSFYNLSIPLERGRLFGDSLIHLGMIYEKCTHSIINTRH